MCKYQIDKSPYVLDAVVGLNIPAITRKNVDFINAVVRLDSRYAKNFKIVEPDDEFDPEIANSRMNAGSIPFWFNKMKEKNADFRKCILGAIVAIDRSNSTHLNASSNGRIEMRDRICICCKNYSDLIKALNVPFDSSNQKHLISILTEKIDTGEGTYRHNLSFASKFCAYAAKYLQAKIQYSKYDKIVSGRLPEYSNFYLGKHDDTNTYICRPQDDLSERLKVYERYSTIIQKILDKLAEKKLIVSREEFDHIVWYANKDNLHMVN